MFQKNNLKIINADCMDIMKNYADNYFDLAIVDPPYGIGIAKWDNAIPSEEYFNELYRVSKKYIIWGANYFKIINSNNYIVWNKKPFLKQQSESEIAFCNFKTKAKIITYQYAGNFENGRVDYNKKSIHPTQKPTKLYDILLENYATTDDKILDTHLGSGSSAIAAFYYGCKEFVGMEIDENYYNKSIKRIKEKTKQIKLF